MDVTWDSVPDYYWSGLTTLATEFTWQRMGGGFNPFSRRVVPELAE